MRWVERWFGVLAAGLALIALAFALSQHVTQVFTGTALYGSGYSATSALAAYVPLGLAVAAALLACFAAVRDSGLGVRRSVWTMLLALAALICLGGVVALALNNIWVEVGAPPAVSADISAAAVFAPAALAALIAMFSALRPRHAAA